VLDKLVEKDINNNKHIEDDDNKVPPSLEGGLNKTILQSRCVYEGQ
jgi:hypothetical protein